MDSSKKFTENELSHFLISRSSLVFHSYFDRDINQFVELLDPNFVWIGSYEFQFTKGIQEFLAITKEEQNELQAQVYDEEYHILSHDGNTWVVYGSFSASAWMDEKTFLYTKQRATYIWKWVNNDFKLLHLHCTMTRDIPLVGDFNIKDIHTCEKPDLRWYDYMLRVENERNTQRKHMTLKDNNGDIHYLLPAEILGVSISYRVATVYTASGNFFVHQTLNTIMDIFPNLMKVHKSWLVNPIYVRQVKRYQILLSNGLEVPIGKSRYNEIREQLKLK